MKNLPDHICGFLVDDPVVLAFRVFGITVRWLRAERLSGVVFDFEHGTHFRAGALGLELIKKVDKRRYVVLSAIDGICFVVDGD